MYSLRLEEIVALLRQRWRLVLLITVPVVLIGFIGSLMTTKVYKASTLVQVSPVIGQEMQGQQVVNTDLHYVRNTEQFYRTQLEILKSALIRDTVAEKYNAIRGEGASKISSFELSLRMSVVPLPNSELIRVTVQYPDPVVAATLANLFTEVYQQKNLEGRQDSAIEARRWLDQEIEEYRERIQDINARVIQYQSEFNLADAGEAVTDVSATLQTLNRRLGDVTTERVLVETTYDLHLDLARRGLFEELAKDMATPMTATLWNKHADAVATHAKLAARYGEKHPERQAAMAELVQLEAELKSEVERTIAGERVQLSLLKNKEASIQEELSMAKEGLLERQSLGNGFAVLVSEQKRAQQTFEELSQRENLVEMQAKTQLNNVRIIEQASAPSDHFKPDLTMNLVLSLVTGLLLGIGYVVLREQLNSTISSPFDVVTYLKVPYLGMIPRVDVPQEERALYTHHNPKSVAAESMRAVRTMIEARRPEGPIRRMLVTSAVSSEGKTGSCSRMAVSFSNLGRRVLVIDCDLRRPRMHKVFGRKRRPGFVEVVRDGLDVTEAIVKTDVPGVDLLSAGDSVAHPNELLSSDGTVRLLDTLDGMYDVIMVDSPPIGLLSDGLVLAKLVDGVMIVVRDSRVSRHVAREAIRRLEQVGANIFGALLNDVSSESGVRNYNYYYYYQYGYDYAYADSDVVEDDEAGDTAAK